MVSHNWISSPQLLCAYAGLVWLPRPYLYCLRASWPQHLWFPQGKQFPAFSCGAHQAHGIPDYKSSALWVKCIFFVSTIHDVSVLMDYLNGTWSFFSVLHRNKLTHTDLKPENILFINSDYDMEYNSDMVSCPWRSFQTEVWWFVSVAIMLLSFLHRNETSEHLRTRTLK